MPVEELSLEERVQIEVGVACAEKARGIARRLDRPASTVTRELARNGGREGYSAVAANERAACHRHRPKLTSFAKDPRLASHVEARLRALDSPMTISVELARRVYPEISATVSHETIYAAVYAHGAAGLVKGLHGCLHRRRRCRKPDRHLHRSRLPAGRLISSPASNNVAVAFTCQVLLWLGNFEGCTPNRPR